MSGILVAGMHFSGLDLATEALAQAGWMAGKAPTPDDSRGTHFDDPTLVQQHLRWLAGRVTPPPDLPSWGVTNDADFPSLTTAALSDTDPLGLSAVSQQRVDELSSFGRPWLMQDALTIVTAPVWAMATAAQFLFVYRNPWDCVESAVRSGQAKLVDDPDLVRETWLKFNRTLIRFAQANPERCTVVAAEALAQDAAAVVGHFGVDGLEIALPTSDFAVRDEGSAIASVYRQVYPELGEVLDQLDALADIPRPSPAETFASSSTFDHVLPGGTLPPGTGTQAVIVCGDDHAFLAEAVASVAASAASPVELTVVDDGCTDDEARRVLQQLRQAGVQVLVTEGVGAARATNSAAGLSESASIVSLAATDRILAPLLAHASLTTNGTADVVCGTWRDFGIRDDLHTPQEPSALTMFPENQIGAPALVARSLMTTVSGWDPEFGESADWDFWLGCLGHQARFHVVEEPTAEVLVRTNATVHAEVSDHSDVLAGLAEKHHALLGPHLGVYVAELGEQVRLRDRELELRATELNLMRSLHLNVRGQLATELEQLKAAVGRLQRELREQPSQGARRRLRAPEAPRRITADDPLLFLHVRKTGGTAFRRMLQAEFGRELVFPSDDDLLRSPLGEYPTTAQVAMKPDELPTHAILIGHFDAGLLAALERNYRTAAFLRHPLDRALSELAWQARMDSRDVSYYLQWPEYLEERIANLQTKQLAGAGRSESKPPGDEELLEAAWGQLVRLDFLGITERYVESCTRFDELFGTTLVSRLMWDNVTRPVGDELTEHAEVLAPYLELDIALYERALARFEGE